MLNKHTLSIVLSVILTFSNVVCACAIASVQVPEIGSNSHHHELGSPPSTDCIHNASDGCDIASAISLESTTLLVGAFKVDFDKDENIAETFALQPTVKFLVYDSPPLISPAWSYDTPVSRRDLLLE